MPLELQVIRANDFIRLGAEGHFDVAASKVALADVATACRKRGINRALLDLRALQPQPAPIFSPTDLANLVNTFGEIGFTYDQKLAVLYSSDPHHRAKMFAFIGSLRGWHVAAFGSFEEAMEWLSDDEKTAGNQESRLGEETVQLKIRTAPESQIDPQSEIRPKH